MAVCLSLDFLHLQTFLHSLKSWCMKLQYITLPFVLAVAPHESLGMWHAVLLKNQSQRRFLKRRIWCLVSWKVQTACLSLFRSLSPISVDRCNPKHSNRWKRKIRASEYLSVRQRATRLFVTVLCLKVDQIISLFVYKLYGLSTVSACLRSLTGSETVVVQHVRH